MGLILMTLLGFVVTVTTISIAVWACVIAPIATMMNPSPDDDTRKVGSVMLTVYRWSFYLGIVLAIISAIV